MNDQFSTIETSHLKESQMLRKAFPLSAVTLALPLLVLSTVVKADGIERDSDHERFRQSVSNFYSWMPAVQAADCPAGKHWAVASNGGIAQCVGNPAPSGGGGGGYADSGYYGDGGGGDSGGGDGGSGGAGGDGGCGADGGGCDAGGGADGGGGDGGGGGGDGGGGGGDGG